MTAGEPAEAESLRDRIGDLVDGWDGVEQVTMFGCPSFTARGTLFCVVSEQGLSLTRLPPDDRAALDGLVAVSPFDADGRTVESWATVAPDDLPDDATLEPFVRTSYEAAREEASR